MYLLVWASCQLKVLVFETENQQFFLVIHSLKYGKNSCEIN